MRLLDYIDVRTLIKEADSSEHKESFHVLERTKMYRIGFGVRTSLKSSSFFLEVSIYSHSINEHNTRSNITQQLPLLKKLQKRGYMISCQDETCTVLEIQVPQNSLSTELKYLKTMLHNTFQD